MQVFGAGPSAPRRSPRSGPSVGAPRRGARDARLAAFAEETEWLGEEWARPEDEDDGLVVMLKARIENLQGQLAAFEKRGAGPRGSANERS